MYRNERAASLTNCLSRAGAAQLVRNYKASPRQLLPRDFFFSLLRGLFTARHALAFLPSSSRSQKSNIKRDRPWERPRASLPPPTIPGELRIFYDANREVDAPLFVYERPRMYVYPLFVVRFVFFFFFTLYRWDNFNRSFAEDKAGKNLLSREQNVRKSILKRELCNIEYKYSNTSHMIYVYM